MANQHLTQAEINALFGPGTLVHYEEHDLATMMSDLIEQLRPAHPDIQAIADNCSEIAMTALATRLQCASNNQATLIVTRPRFIELFVGPYNGIFEELRDVGIFVPRAALYWYTLVLITACTQPRFREEMQDRLNPELIE